MKNSFSPKTHCLTTLIKIGELVAFAKKDATNTYREINFSNIPNFQAKIIEEETGVNVKGCLKCLTASGVRHAFSSHGNPELEAERNQIGLTDHDFELIPSILSAPDSYEKGLNNRRGNAAILFKKTIDGRNYHVVMSIVKEKDMRKLMFNTMYIKQ